MLATAGYLINTKISIRKYEESKCLIRSDSYILSTIYLEMSKLTLFSIDFRTYFDLDFSCKLNYFSNNWRVMNDRNSSVSSLIYSGEPFEVNSLLF